MCSFVIRKLYMVSSKEVTISRVDSIGYFIVLNWHFNSILSPWTLHLIALWLSLQRLMEMSSKLNLLTVHNNDVPCFFITYCLLLCTIYCCLYIMLSNTYRFFLSDDQNPNRNSNRSYRTPVLRKRWYEVGVISVRVLIDLVPNNASYNTANKTIVVKDFNNDMCLKLNEEKSIVDSGTTNIRLPESVFKEVTLLITNLTNFIINLAYRLTMQV